jgi:hypothetical protein
VEEEDRSISGWNMGWAGREAKAGKDAPIGEGSTPVVFSNARPAKSTRTRKADEMQTR